LSFDLACELLDTLVLLASPDPGASTQITCLYC
jgi:hypothetical protein